MYLIAVALLMMLLLFFYVSNTKEGYGHNDKPMDHDNADNMGVWDNIDYVRPEFKLIDVNNSTHLKNLKYTYDVENDYQKWLTNIRKNNNYDLYASFSK